MTACPQHSTLVAFEQGDLTETDARPIESHVRGCETCKRSIDGIRQADADAQVLRTVFQTAPDESSLLTGSLDAEPAGESVDASRPSDGHADPGSGHGSGSGAPRGQPVSAVPAQGPTGSKVSDLHVGGSGSWIIPDYEPVLLCGEGSYGSVWAVRDRVGVYRALKIIDLDRMSRANIRCYEKSALEAYCRKVARHPNLVTIYHVGFVGHYLYYTMELADDLSRQGSVRDSLPEDYQPLTLDTFIRGRRMHADVAMELARRLARGLAKLHDGDLVHRDIKPSNIIFVNRQPKLADIGVLTVDDGSGRIVGTPRYMSPDHAKDKTADIYAFGKVLHEMIAGRDDPTFPALPEECFWGSSKWDLERVSDVIVRACAESASERYPNAAIMLEELEACSEPAYFSLFDELENSQQSEQSPKTAQILIQLAFAFIYRIPWIAGLIVVLYILSKIM